MLGLRIQSKRLRPLGIIATALVAQYAFTAPAFTEELAARRARLHGELNQALDQQDRWLGTDANAQAWRTWLRADQIRTELTAQPQPDRIALDQTLARYASNAPGLENPNFVGVKTALTLWLETLPEPTPEELAAFVRASIAPSAAPGAAHLESSRNKLSAALARLDEHLAGSPKYGAAWRAYLAYAELLTELTHSGDAVDLTRLERIRAHYESGHVGLERPAVHDVRDCLVEYCQQVRIARLADPAAALAEQLERLATHLEKDGRKRRANSLEEIAAALDWCERHGLAMSVVEVVRRAYVRPNLYVQIAAAAVLKPFEQQLDETIPIHDVQNGATIYGTGHLSGRVSFELLPNSEQAAIRLLFTGSLQTDIVGHSGPVGFASSGRTELNSQQLLLADAAAIAAQPSAAQAQTNLQVTGIWTDYSRPLLDRLVRRVGSRRLAESRPSTEYNISRRAELNLSQRFDAEAAKLVAEVNISLVDQLRVPLTKEGIYPSEIRLSTTREHICVRATQAASGQLAALSPRPVLDDAAPIALAVHESAINNTTSTSLAGQVVQSTDLAGVLDKMLGEAPPEFAAVNGIPWSLTMADVAPFEVRFSAEGVRVTVRCVKITAGPEEMNIPLAVTARYTASIDGPAVVFRRQGDLTVMGPCFADPTADGGSKAASKEAVRERFEMLFQEELRFTSSQLPLDLPGKENLVPKQFTTTDDGWLITAFDIKDPTTIAANRNR